MDDYMFRSYVTEFKCVQEETSYLEIFNYSDPSFNTSEEHRFRFDELPDEFGNFLHRRAYEEMVRTLHLPFRAIEGTSAVGPFFWAAFDQDDEDPHLQIIFRKSDVRKKGKTRGWELMLSHSFRTHITSGFAKGTASSDMVESIKHLRACAAQILHPLLLPTIILSHDLSMKNDQKQRNARQWLRDLETAVSMRSEVLEEENKYIRGTMIDLDQINMDLVECHSQVLWKRPQAYQEIIRGVCQAMDRFWEKARDDEAYGGQAEGDRELRTHYARAADDSAGGKSKLGLTMAGEQRRLAHASKRDSTSMKILSLLGAIFLPATYLASIFGMTFFNFVPRRRQRPPLTSHHHRYRHHPPPQTPQPPHRGTPSPPYYGFISPSPSPVTLIIVVCWRWWNRRREAQYAKEDRDVEERIEKMEAQIMATMRKRTMSKMRTWEVGKT
ncbi:hypothetical protein CHGG_05837 [Chaetomium globosum CBS 148.51]|uniref:Uncharacterized protein n=1 Tax=Chaetomium globosum (strain ATCC 6205 / CBS 148.51 / DSM 1962 / NBRC 6347 / NRRL 1970) TaxID=306901 RepID=Q2H678_CHAGB|nr:uncharacterized protein CHGG_05837 [Chaetomium globosum CBS 148.51]EAQ89218.1 hypothetical protein CHGG_05837 [Chaetomium globosum CBS 148.51]